MEGFGIVITPELRKTEYELHSLWATGELTNVTNEYLINLVRPIPTPALPLKGRAQNEDLPLQGGDGEGDGWFQA
jgi:hypothetical protein